MARTGTKRTKVNKVKYQMSKGARSKAKKTKSPIRARNVAERISRRTA